MPVLIYKENKLTQKLLFNWLLFIVVSYNNNKRERNRDI